MSQYDNNTKPLLIGKLSKLDDNIASLTGYLGDSERISMSEYDIIHSMDGFNTFDDIARLNNVSIEVVENIFTKYKKKQKRISTLEDWNQISWCKECKVYVAGSECGICSQPTQKIVFDPPCDPWIAQKVEREFIVKILKEKFDITLSDNALLLMNNGVYKNKFFWQIAYNGTIILSIDFNDTNIESWEYKLQCTKEEILDLPEVSLDDDTQERIIRANHNRQKELFDNSALFIRETTNICNTLPLIYFSGGKESMVIYSLYDKLKIRANVLTVAGGVDFPEDLCFMKECKKMIEENDNFNFYFYESDGKDILEYLQREKVLSAKTPWCRKNFKRELKSKAMKDIYNGKFFVACEGSRWYENDFRRRHMKIQYIGDYENQLWTHPIAEWTYFDVWNYMLENKLPINYMYYKGYQRTTCWLCPIVNPFHLYNSRKNYPELWEKIKGCTLEAFGKEISTEIIY